MDTNDVTIDAKIRCVCGRISHVRYVLDYNTGILISSENNTCQCKEFNLSIMQKETKAKINTIYPNCQFAIHSSKRNLQNLKFSKPEVLEQKIINLEGV